MHYFLIFICSLSSLFAEQIIIATSDGRWGEIDINTSMSLSCIIDQAATILDVEPREPMDFYLTFSAAKKDKKGAPSHNGRSYDRALTAQEEKDVTYIIRTLAWAPLSKLMGHKSSLQKAGDRIDSIHPLRFLGFVFSNEELKAGAHAIRHRTLFIWGEFWSGLKESLEKEYNLGNMTASQIADFSQKVGIDSSLINPAIESHQWQDFFDLLLQHIPRNENAGRYDM